MALSVVHVLVSASFSIADINDQLYNYICGLFQKLTRGRVGICDLLCACMADIMGFTLFLCSMRK